MTAPSRAMLALPTVAVAAVAFAVLVLGRPRPVVGARLRGGPTEGARELSFRLEVVERNADGEVPLAGHAVTLRASFPGGDAATWTGALDDEGSAPVSLALSAREPVHGPVRVVIDDDRAGRVADAAVSVTRAAWTSSATRHGGWVHGAAGHTASIRAAVARGVFAVPYRDPLFVELVGVALTNSPVAIAASADGGALEGAVALSRAHPRGTLFLTPSEHAPSVSLSATLSDGETPRLDLAPAVVPGALHASLVAGQVVVESPIPRDRAYVALVTETERLAGATVRLTPTDGGGARGAFVPPPLPPLQVWAVVSSEPDLHSGALVGWPLRETKEPATTFDVPDVLALDTVGAAWNRELARVRRVRSRAALASVIALALTFLVMSRGARRARSRLEAHLSEASADDDLADRLAGSGAEGRWLVYAALSCLAVAAIMAAVFAVWR